MIVKRTIFNVKKSINPSRIIEVGYLYCSNGSWVLVYVLLGVWTLPGDSIWQVTDYLRVVKYIN